MRVQIILDTEFGERLERLDKSSPIWIVQSAANDPVIARLWQSKTGDITSFRPQEFGQLIDTVDQHHFGWLEIDAYGVTAENAASELAEYGEGTMSPTLDGFVFRRFSVKNPG